MANVFNGGLFLGVALYHLIPQSNKYMDAYLKLNYPDSNIKEVPLSYFICFLR